MRNSGMLAIVEVKCVVVVFRLSEAREGGGKTGKDGKDGRLWENQIVGREGVTKWVRIERGSDN